MADPQAQAQAVQSGIIQSPPTRTTSTNVYRPLNVKDALSYLDQVKIQFYNQADVYNNFLDIMKDFKSQSIDTPGVIDRVSTLFRGHPNLIQGFNTFLPPGYRIECSLDPSDPNPIRVTTPTGTTTRPNIGGSYDQWNEQDQAQAQQQQQQQQQQLVHQQESESDGNSDQMNHAITYVNKIKTRFANQPDTYKQFLEILQTYQREQKPIGEVYEQVTVLFANSPDLLDDFKQFLPDTSAQSNYDEAQGSQLPPVGNFHAPSGNGLSPNGSSHFSQKYAAGDANGNSYDSKKRKSVDGYYYEGNYDDAQYSSVRSSVSQTKPKPGSQLASKNGYAVVTNPTLVPGIPEPIAPSSLSKSPSFAEELNFFDKVKKAIGNKQSYNDFLKLLNLYSQDIIDKETLVEKVDSFIGDLNADLMKWFKMFVGYEDKPQHIESIMFKKHHLELSLCKAHGPSYRQLPKAETYMPCSGRDEMCWEVLNDEWVGHPTWASEDSGFIAHRKNQYEEILFKIEEERLEYDYHMEANLRTIQTLETIANRIANMTPEQKANFKLPPGLGHTSVTIYKKVMRKIYDKDRGFEVIDALHENPAIAVPIVLKRLKQKDEEWKRAQREWNKVWREMEQKVFYKSLDHLGLTFKQADKKLLTAKQLVSEISTVKVEQQNKRLYPLTPKPQEQLNYEFTDFDVLFDILKLSNTFINKSSNYSSNDREKLTQFFKFFMSLFFDIEMEKIEEILETKSSEQSSESSKTNGNGVNNETSVSLKKRPRHDDDLLRDVLKKQTRSRNGHEESAHLSSESDEPDVNIEDIAKPEEFWINTTGRKFSLAENEGTLEPRDTFNLFCNTTIYVFFRHLRTLYERLEEVKGMNEEVAKEISSRSIPQFAKDLNLVSHQLEDVNVEIDGSKDCYQQVLALAERLIEGDLEHQWFEESVRQAYRNRGYKIYTIDKVVQAMIKHMHAVVTDSKTAEMMVLFETDRKSKISSAKDQILYRMNVRSLMASDENMFKVSYKENEHTVNIQFVSLDDLTINDHKSAEEQYNYYVTSYVMSHPTEGVPASKINMPFSRDFIENVDEEQCHGFVDAGLKVSICENSYRLFFEADTHDQFTAQSVYEKPEEIKKDDKSTALTKHLEDAEVGWKATLTEGANAEEHESNWKNLLEKGVSGYKMEVEEESKPSEIEPEKFEPSVQIEKSQDNHEDKKDDADMTLVQDHNDTTIQQDGNDTTTDETMNQEDMSIAERTQTTSAATEEKV